MDGISIVQYNLNDERIQYLIQTDKILAKLIRCIGTCELQLEENGFICLVKYIIGQQISDKARETIWLRICALLGNVTPAVILSTNDESLRKAGLSGRKIKYIKTLAERVTNGSIAFEKFQTLPNEEVISQLISVKGIGRWTAEMYLIFSLGRENVLSRGDGTIKRTIRWMYQLDELPSSVALSEFFANWADYATIVSAYLWKAIALGLTQKPFDEVICLEDNI